MAHHIGLQVLRAKIRGLQATGFTISSRIHKAAGKRKNDLWNTKRALGVHCRHHLIAYGFLRGVPYYNIEQCAANNKPKAQYVLDIINQHNMWDSKRGYVRYDLEMVKQLLDGGVGRWVKQGGTKPPQWVIEKFPASTSPSATAMTASLTAGSLPASQKPTVLTVIASSAMSPATPPPMQPTPCLAQTPQSTSDRTATTPYQSVGQSVVRLLEKIMGAAR